MENDYRRNNNLAYPLFSIINFNLYALAKECHRVNGCISQ